MKHLNIIDVSLQADKILSNWSTTAEFIYNPAVTMDDLKSLIKYEVLNKNREMIVERLVVRLLSVMKLHNRSEIIKDIEELSHG